MKIFLPLMILAWSLPAQANPRDSFERLYGEPGAFFLQSHAPGNKIEVKQFQRDIHSQYDDDILQVTRDLIGFKTVAQDGKATTDMPEFVGLRSYVKELCKRLGLAYATYANDQIIEISAGSGNETLAFYTHADVMPAGNGWDETHDIHPWDAKVHNGILYGRGAIDDKGPTASIIYSMKALKNRGGIPSGRRVALVITTKEELGDWDDVEAFSKERNYKWNVVADSVFPAKIAEKGLLQGWLTLPIDPASSQAHLYSIISLKAGLKHNQVSDQAEATIATASAQALMASAAGYNKSHPMAKVDVSPMEKGMFHVIAAGKTAHAMNPHTGHSATGDLVEFLSALDLQPDSYATFVRAVNQLFGTQDGSSLGIAAPEDHQFTPPGTTVINSILKEENGMLKASFDVRYHPKFNAAQVQEVIRAKARAIDPRFDVTLKENFKPKEPYFNNPDDDFVRKLVGIYNDEAQAHMDPLSNGGGTVTRVLTGEHKIVFGPVEPGNTSQHGPNEYIPMASFNRLTDIYSRAMAEIISTQ